MSGILSNMVDKLRGLDPEQEDKNKQRATEAEADYEKTHGPTTEEPGIQEDYTLEDLAATGLSPVGVARMGTRAATRGLVSRLIEEGEMPQKSKGNGHLGEYWKTEKPAISEGAPLNYSNAAKPTQTEATTGFTNNKYKYDSEPEVTKPKFPIVRKKK